MWPTSRIPLAGEERAAASVQRRQHSLADWLALHQLDAATCHRILEAIAGTRASDPPIADSPDHEYRTPDLDAAWHRVVEALRRFLPERQDIIDATFAGTTRIVLHRPDGSRKAVTIDNGPAEFPTILFSYRGAPADILMMAHEFGHALQIRASMGRLVPPIMREVCAFLAEYALMSHVQQRRPAHYNHLAKAWRKDDQRYFGAHRDRLAAAMLAPATPYLYSWNYPVARYLASQIVERYTHDRIWRIFTGEASVQVALQELA